MIAKGARVTLQLDRKEVAAMYLNPVTADHSLVRLVGEFRTSPTDDGLRTVETKVLDRPTQYSHFLRGGVHT